MALTINQPLAESYAIAALTEDHSDRVFLARNAHQVRDGKDFHWCRTYRAAEPFRDFITTTLMVIKIKDEPEYLKGIDPNTICVLKTSITFEMV